MNLQPLGDRLIVEAKVAPQDIDQLRLGQAARVRFMAFNQRTTPEITGSVSRISADAVTDSAPASPTTPSASRSIPTRSRA